MDEDIVGQSLYLQWTNRQTRAINIPTMDEQTDKGIVGIVIALVCLHPS